MIQIASPEIGDEEIAAVNEVMKSGIIAQGAKVAQLEEEFAKYCGTKHAVAVNSGTAAIHVALHAAGVGEDDEVITVPFSFIATINPILMVGARPILVDIDPETYCIDVSKLKAAITPRTKAIIPVHLYGQVADMDELNEIAKENNLIVIEDACQSIAADYKEKKSGSLGDLGCFSLYATKNIMCGEGGMVTTNSDEYAASIRRSRQHGMTAPYVYSELGYNYRLTDLQAAIAIEQLKKVKRFTTKRQSNAGKLLGGLSGIRGLTLPITAGERNHVFHQFTVRVNNESRLSRDDFISTLREKGINAGAYYPSPLHAYPHIARLGYVIGDFPKAERAADEVLSLPVHPALSDDDVQYIIDTVREVANV